MNMGRGREDIVQLCKAWQEYNGGKQGTAAKDEGTSREEEIWPIVTQRIEGRGLEDGLDVEGSIEWPLPGSPEQVTVFSFFGLQGGYAIRKFLALRLVYLLPEVDTVSTWGGITFLPNSDRFYYFVSSYVMEP